MSKLLLMGDLHIDNTRIKTRQDNVLAACMDKIGQIFAIAHNHKCSAILQPGDFFESDKANDFLKQFIINYLNSGLANMPIYTVYGNHDLRYHSSNILNTPLKVLDSARVIRILGKKPIMCKEDYVNIYGQSWFEDIPEIEEKLEGINVLVCHKMVVDTKIWEGQEDHIYGKTLLLKTKFDLIVSGDNHQTFVIHSGTGKDKGKRILVNAGCILRTRIDQEDHRPCVFVYNANPKKGEPMLEKIYLIVDDFENVIQIEEARKEKLENEKLKQFVAALDVDIKLTGMNYRQNVFNVIHEDKSIDKPTHAFINLIFERLGN